MAAWAFDCAVAMLQTSSLSPGVMLAAAAAAMECSIILQQTQVSPILLQSWVMAP